MKKRYIIAALFALELGTLGATLPAAAQIIDRVSFSVPQKAISVKVGDEVGISRFVVTSNAPFALVSKDSLGDFDIKIHKSGAINGNRFGDNAQMPGPAQRCATALSENTSTLYMSERKTAAHKGPILSQSVIVEVRHAVEITPKLKIVTQDEAADFQTAPNCDLRAS